MTVLTMAATLGTGRLLWAPPPRRSHVSGEKQKLLGGETRQLKPSLDAGRRRRGLRVTTGSKITPFPRGGSAMF